MGRWLQFTGRGYHDGGQRAVKNTGTHVTRRHRSGAQVCRSCTFSTCARAVVVQFGAITLSGSPVSRLGDADDERRQAMRNSLADKLTVEAKGLADLKVEKAAVEGERRKVEADLGPVKYLATLLGAPTRTCSAGSSWWSRYCSTRPRCDESRGGLHAARRCSGLGDAAPSRDSKLMARRQARDGFTDNPKPHRLSAERKGS